MNTINNDTGTFPDTPTGISQPHTGNSNTDTTPLRLEVQSTVAEKLSHTEISQETTKEINYQKLATEHAELIEQRKTSLEIAQWIGDKLNIPSWKAGEFYGERKVLSSPKTAEELVRLQQFMQTLKVLWTKANGGSDNHSQYLLLDDYVQNALFGFSNMARQVDTKLDIFDTDWKKMGNDFTAKAQYLLEKVGLDIKGDWSKLTGIRRVSGIFNDSDELSVSGSLTGRVDLRWGLDKRLVHRLSLNQRDSSVAIRYANSARLCFLA